MMFCLHICMNVYHVCVRYSEKPKEDIESPGTRVIVSYRVGAKTRTWALFKNSKYF